MVAKRMVMRYCLSVWVLLPLHGIAQTDSVPDITQLKAWMQVLASDSLKGRANFSPELKKAALYIRQSLVTSGIQSFFTNGQYFQLFPDADASAQASADSSDETYNPTQFLANVLGVLPGRSKPDEVVIFSAHYDHVGTTRSRRDSVCNGANDNASGVTALLAIAQILGKQQNNERTIFFCAFAGEELGLVGSNYFVAGINPKKIVAVVNLEMLSRTKGVGVNRFFLTGSSYSDMKRLFQQRLQNKNGVKLIDEVQSSAGDMFARSDNFPFARLGIAAHTVMSSTDADPCYHQPCDNWTTINFEHLDRMIQTVMIATTGLIDGSEWPKLRRLPKE